MTTSTARRRFLEEYRHIRRAEGRGSDDGSYYRALPFVDLSNRNSEMWKMRAATYRHFEKRVLAPLEKALRRPLDILDLGAGNCWLSYRLAQRNHRPVAIDIFDDDLDGLGAARHYPVSFSTIETDFDEIPAAPQSFDLAVYNSSFHYSTDYVRSLSEARRCLRKAGFVVILDSPLYRNKEAGRRMVEERHADFLKRYGFRSDAIPSIEFLDTATLKELSRINGIDWRFLRPWYGWRWHLRPFKALLQNRRPPSRFHILIGRFGA